MPCMGDLAYSDSAEGQPYFFNTVYRAHSTSNMEKIIQVRTPAFVMAKRIPGCKLVLSGASIPGRSSDADSMSLLPLEMGLPKNSLIIMTTARDSDDEAKSFSEL